MSHLSIWKLRIGFCPTILLLRELDVVKKLICTKVRCRRKEAGYLHFAVPVVLQHMYRSLRKQDNRTCANGVDLAIYKHAAGTRENIDNFFSIRMSVRGLDGLAWLNTDHTHGCVFGIQPLLRDQPAQTSAR